jgi:hypothetical protein
MDQGAQQHKAHKFVVEGPNFYGYLNHMNLIFFGGLTKCFNLCDNAQEMIGYSISKAFKGMAV